MAPEDAMPTEQHSNELEKPVASSQKLAVGDLLDDQYRIIGVLGRGGMGVVYRGYDERLKRDVAIKLLHSHLLEGPKGDNIMKRFQREAVLLANLRHSNIITIYDTGTIGALNFIVLEFVNGKTLSQILKENRVLDVRQACMIMTEVCRGMEYAHSQQVIHRDLKPGNLMLSNDNGVKIMDFGLAKALSGDNTPLTRAGQIMGTTYYMPPELIKFQKSDPRGDVYSLGCILYEMLTGDVPFNGKSTGEVLTRVIKEPPIPPSQRNPSISRDMDVVLLRCLEKNPEERFQSAQEFENAISLFLAIHGTPNEAPKRPASASNVNTPTVLTGIRDLPTTAVGGLKDLPNKSGGTLPKAPGGKNPPLAAPAPPSDAALAEIQKTLKRIQKERMIYQVVIVLLLLAMAGVFYAQ